MRFFAVALAVAALTVGGCAGDDDGGNDTGPGGTPAPTNDDPGPNDTSDGPATIQGTLVFDGTAVCIELADDTGERRQLVTTDYEVAPQADGTSRLVATDDGRVLADEGDTLVVTGTDSDLPAGACGPSFAVESLNSVIPAG